VVEVFLTVIALRYFEHGCFQAQPREARRKNAVAGLISRTSLFIIKIKRRIRGVFAVLPFLSLGLVLLLLLHLEQQRTVDTWQDTTESDGGADQSIQLLVTTDGQLQMAGGDTLDFQILSSVTRKFEDFRSQVFQNSCDIDRS
jgi:hypothetical protein